MSSKFASLHSGLLARKGEAAPAVPSPYGVYTDHAADGRQAPRAPQGDHAAHTDAYENMLDPRTRPDMPWREQRHPVSHPSNGRRDISTRNGDAPLIASKADAVPAVPSDMARLENALSTGLNRAAPPRPREKTGPKRIENRTAPFRVSVRLTADQRRKLGHVVAQHGCTRQYVLSHALEEYLERVAEDDMKSCNCLHGECRDEENCASS